MKTLESILSQDMEGDIQIDPHIVCKCRTEGNIRVLYEPGLTYTLYPTAKGEQVIFFEDTPIYEIRMGGSAVSEITACKAKVNDAAYMFRGATIEAVDLTELDTSACKSMSHMFDNTNIERGDITGLNVSNTSIANYMFYKSNELEDTDDIRGFAGLEFRKLTDGACMFRNCNKLKHVRLPGLANKYNVAKQPNFVGAFAYCPSLVKIEIPGMGSAGNLKDLFSEDKKLEYVDISGIPHKNASGCPVYDYMFAGCQSLKHVVLPESLYEAIKTKPKNAGLTQEQFDSIKWEIR